MDTVVNGYGNQYDELVPRQNVQNCWWARPPKGWDMLLERPWRWERGIKEIRPSYNIIMHNPSPPPVLARSPLR